jgi:hypothetical protein
MKKTIIKITTATVFTVMGFTAMAQNADRKPAIDESDKNIKQDKIVTTTAAPQIVPAPKAMTVTEQPKPIVPGGEFKPVDTNVPVKNYAKTITPENAALPPQPVVPKQQ